MDSETMLTSQTLRLKEISLKLRSFNCQQSSLILIESLFFDVLSILRSIRESKGENMLDGLLAVKENEYRRAQEHYRSVKGAEKAIKQFRVGFKRALDKVLANSVLRPASVN